MSGDPVSFSVARKRLQEFFEKFVPTKRKECINPFCMKHTESAMRYVWYAHWPEYVHKRQEALNKTTMRVNDDTQEITTPYCCECFARHVLVRDHPFAPRHYGNYRLVEVDFHWEPTPSTYYDSGTKRLEYLTEFQKSMLCRPVD